MLLETTKAFEPGTTGWTAEDLLDPEIERQWQSGRHEIVEGVLTIMPAAYYSGGKALFNLLFLLRQHMEQAGQPGQFAMEVDIVIAASRVVVADAVMMSPEDERRQAQAARQAGAAAHGQTRLLVPPTLVIESISPGHEVHDRDLKRGWYIGFGVPNYWMLDAHQRSLECLVLEGGAYREQAVGRGEEQVRPGLFAPLVIELGRVW